MNIININRIVRYAVMVMVLLAACTKDSIENDPQQQGSEATQKNLKTLTAIAYSEPFFQVDPLPTRALPSGYKPYREVYPITTPRFASIGVCMKPGEGADDYKILRLSGNTWSGGLSFAADNIYYLYGFMPAEAASSASVVAAAGGYDEGATMTITNLDVLTPADVCVIVGVQKTAEAGDISDSGIELGRFSYVGSADENYVYLLLKHLYAGLHFKVHLSTEYAALRSIKIKKMTLTTTENISKKINLNVVLTANDTGTDPVTSVTYTNAELATEPATVKLFPFDASDEAATGSGNELTVPVEVPQDLLSCFAPSRCSAFTLYTKYDVYDSKGNLIRKDCEAYNKIDPRTLDGFTSLNAGDIYTVDLQIAPTYLYVLSEPDLDNPTFVIE